MKIRNILAWIGMILSVVMGVVILATPIANWWVLVCIITFVASTYLFKTKSAETDEEDEENEEEEKTPVNWLLLVAWILVLVTGVVTILTAIFTGWLFLLPLVALCAATTWLVWLIRRDSFVLIPVVALVISLILLGVYGITGSLLKDWNKALDTLTVENLVVENATVDVQTVTNETVTNQKVENQTVTNQKVENQTVTNQKVENSTVTNQKVENQTVTNQKVENSTVTNQKVENQTVTNQKVENQTVTNQKVENQTVTNQKVENSTPKEETPKEETPKEETPKEETPKEETPKEETPKEETPKEETPKEETPKEETPKEETPKHTHSYTSKTVAPTCTEKGYTIHTCSCGHSYKDAEKAALGHDYTSKVVKPTTEAGGYTEHTCSRCGNSYKDAYTEQLVAKFVVTNKGTTTDGKTYWDVRMDNINMVNVSWDWSNKCKVDQLSANTFRLTKTHEGTCYFTVTDDVTGENIVLE